MANELTLAGVGDAIRDRVRTVIMDSMPQEAIDNVIKREVQTYFNSESKAYGSYDSKRTNFQDDVYREVKAQYDVLIKERVKEFFDKQVEGLTDPAAINEAVKKYCAEVAPTLMDRYFQGMARASIEQFLQASGQPYNPYQRPY